eukprot:GILI01001912.1.p2 GENE.GILI01001912.1~~GILI01001912.1.p2  ORF type:complete len:715 (+),score=240.03 GILI01001912.1:68-2212(+)
MSKKLALLAIVLAVACASFAYADSSRIRVGVGIHDITGPVVEIGLMGYGSLSQHGGGIHMRLRARCYIFVDSVTEKRVVFCTNDYGMTFQSIHLAVVDKLKARYGDLYKHENVMLSGTHTHSGPGGYSMYTLYDITSLGFIKESYDSFVEGIFQAIVKAHDNIQDASILMGKDHLHDANINRSPESYLRNPEEERSQYCFNTDHEMTLLKFLNKDGKPFAMLNWFGVHGVSLNNTNPLISGDNKGVASYLFERYMNGPKAIPGKGPFVGAFAQTNEGDMSPNTNGPTCPDGTPCDSVHSTCGGRSQGCIAKGPGADMYESCEIIARKQFNKAVEIFASASEDIVKGKDSESLVDFRFMYADLSNYEVTAEFASTKKPERTCRPALGTSFAAGTTDGPGMFTFTQGDSGKVNPFWKFVSGFLSEYPEEERACQYPKPVLLDLGNEKPMPWGAKIVPFQIARIGKLYLIAVPGEFTTMSGRRLKAQVRKVLIENGADEDITVMISGLSNSYTHYIATYEEFQLQRYEGASTIFGPHTLAAHTQIFSQLAKALATGSDVPLGPTPPDPTKFNLITMQPPVLFDSHPIGGKFGALKQDAKESYEGGQTVEVVFWGANLRSDPLAEDSYLFVEKKEGDNWEIVCTDGCLETRLVWKRHLVSESLVTVYWFIPEYATAGTYRIRHKAVSKAVTGKLTPYEGISREFTVAPQPKKFLLYEF